jgi:SAM-dependent methyltransferase
MTRKQDIQPPHAFGRSVDSGRTSNEEYSAALERFSGFADLYDQYRPTPPALLADLLTRMAQVEFPSLVVDIGSGTGLSTRYWEGRAAQVIGIEPGDDMRCQAEAQPRASSVLYRKGFSHATGLPEACTSVVTCSQALHWMEPQSTFEEARRILQPGGVFAAFDYDWPPATSHWEADSAYIECLARATELEKQLPGQRVKRWGKEQHLARMQASGCFRFAREVVLHQADTGNAERLVGLALSQGGVETLLKQGFTEEQIGIDRLREMAGRFLGSEPRPWVWSARVRFGIK